MRGPDARARRELLTRAQDRLDGILGQEIVAGFIGRDLDDLLLKRIQRRATERLHADDPSFGPLIVSVDLVGKLVSLTARFRINR